MKERQAFLPLCFFKQRGKSGQHRAAYFLTGSCSSVFDRRARESATENNRPALCRVRVKT